MACWSHCFCTGGEPAVIAEHMGEGIAHFLVAFGRREDVSPVIQLYSPRPSLLKVLPHSRSTCSSQQREGCVGKVQENPATSAACPEGLISSPQQGMPLLVYLPGRYISTQGPVWGTGHIDIGTLFLPCSKTAGSQKSGGVPYGLCHPHQQFRRWGRARQVVW